MRVIVDLSTTTYDQAAEFAAMLRDVYPDDVRTSVVKDPPPRPFGKDAQDDTCDGCGREFDLGSDVAEQWGVFHGRDREPWLCPTCIEDEDLCHRLGDQKR